MAEKEGVIRFGLYSIWNSRNGGLYSFLFVVDWAIIDLGGMQETKVTEGVYT